MIQSARELEPWNTISAVSALPFQATATTVPVPFTGPAAAPEHHDACQIPRRRNLVENIIGEMDWQAAPLLQTFQCRKEVNGTCSVPGQPCGDSLEQMHQHRFCCTFCICAIRVSPICTLPGAMVPDPLLYTLQDAVAAGRICTGAMTGQPG